MELVIASNNKNKIKEITQILGNFFDKIYSLKDINIDIEIEENGTSFYENALIKAKTICNLTKMAALADDSGLKVESLGGKPGIFSARYAGKECDNAKNNALLLKNMQGKINRNACFICSMVLYFPDGKIISAEGTAEGSITYKEEGNFGFGYDPLFYSKELNKTFAQCLDAEKNMVSHRGRALNELKNKLKAEKILH